MEETLRNPGGFTSDFVENEVNRLVICIKKKRLKLDGFPSELSLRLKTCGGSLRGRGRGRGRRRQATALLSGTGPARPSLGASGPCVPEHPQPPPWLREAVLFMSPGGRVTKARLSGGLSLFVWTVC